MGRPDDVLQTPLQPKSMEQPEVRAPAKRGGRLRVIVWAVMTVALLNYAFSSLMTLFDDDKEPDEGPQYPSREAAFDWRAVSGRRLRRNATIRAVYRNPSNAS